MSVKKLIDTQCIVKRSGTLTTVRYSAMAERAFCESWRAPSSQTQQWMPRRPEYTHSRWT